MQGTVTATTYFFEIGTELHLEPLRILFKEDQQKAIQSLYRVIPTLVVRLILARSIRTGWGFAYIHCLYKEGKNILDS